MNLLTEFNVARNNVIINVFYLFFILFFLTLLPTCLSSYHMCTNVQISA